MIYMNCTYEQIQINNMKWNSMPTSSNFCDMKRSMQEIKTATIYKSYDDSNIDSKNKSGHINEQHSHFHSIRIRNIVNKASDKMGLVLRVFQ